MAHSPKIIAKVKADYKTGDYSMKKLSEKYHISEPTIRSWLDGKVKKGALKKEMQEAVENKFIKAFAKKGFTEEKVASIIFDMSNANRIIPIGDGATVEVEDWQARDKAITQYAKFTGSYAAEKTENKHKIEIPGLNDILNKVYPDAN